jgi:hypothetical protein
MSQESISSQLELEDFNNDDIDLFRFCTVDPRADAYRRNVFEQGHSGMKNKDHVDFKRHKHGAVDIIYENLKRRERFRTSVVSITLLF